MSKKRKLTLLLALLPLTIGGGIIATVANGSRSADLSADPAAQAPQTETAPEPAEELAAPLPALPFDASMPPETSPAPQHEKAAPKSGEAPLVIEADEASGEPMYASTATNPPAGDVPMLADAGPQLDSALYRLSGRSRGSSGGGGGGEGIGAGPSNGDRPGENTTPPANNTPNDNAKGGKDAGSGPDQTTPGQNEGDDSTEPGPETDPPVYFPPEQPNPPVVQVPEPGPIGLFGLGLLVCALARRKRSATGD